MPPSVPHESAVESSSVLIDIETVAEMLQVSSRTVRRLTDAGRAPAPRKLGSLIRYSRADIESWVAGGCKPVRRP